MLHLAAPVRFVEARLRSRYKRFLADVELPDGSIVTVHCPNPGRMTSLLSDDAEVRLVATPHTKLPYRWVQVKTPHGWVGIDTNTPNLLCKKLFNDTTLAGWSDITLVESEVKIGNSRCDFRLTHVDGNVRWVEVKSVTWFCETPQVSNDEALLLFPDAPSERAAKHIQMLIERVSHNELATVIYVVQHPAGQRVACAESLDPNYATAVMDAKRAGVEFRAIRVNCDDTGVFRRGEELPVQ